MINTVFLLLGGNLGEREEILRSARNNINRRIGKILVASSLYETEAWGKENQENFLNQVLRISTSLNPDDLLTICQEIEKELGRVRFEHWGPRAIDIDILFFNEEIISKENLKIPHPEIQNRMFTLTPLNEISPEFVHPVIEKSVNSLIDICPDKLEVKKII